MNNRAVKKEDDVIDFNEFDYLLDLEHSSLDDFLRSAFNGNADKNLNLLNDLNSALRDDIIKIETDSNDVNFSKKEDESFQSSDSMFEFTNSHSQKIAFPQRTPNRMTTRSQLKRSRSVLRHDESDNENFGEDDDFNNDSDTFSIKEIQAAKRSRNSRSEIEAPKKESNKEAASRYRTKKLSEKDSLFETKQHLEKQNDDVKKKIDHVQTEINYLKNIIVQMLMTKGILNNLTLKMVKPI